MYQCPINLLLLGVWNDDMMDDFLMSNGSRLDTNGRSNLTDREVFAFGQSCESHSIAV